MTSRIVLAGSALLALAGCKAETAPQQPDKQAAAKSIAPEFVESRALADLEKKSGGRLGVFILDTGTGKATGHRTAERFALASTFKMSLAALVLKMAEEGKIRLDQKISYTKADLMQVSPVTEANVGKGSLTVEELARAIQVTSDNAAANLLLKAVGGPQKLTEFWRSLGDETSRLDHIEGRNQPQDKLEDTTTPEAMARTMVKILTGDVLSPANREKLIGWMEATETGKRRLRAGLPKGWRVGDKTGTLNDRLIGNQYNDIAIVWPEGAKAPLIIAAYYVPGSFGKGSEDKDQAVLAEVGRIAGEWIK